MKKQRSDKISITIPVDKSFAGQEILRKCQSLFSRLEKRYFYDRYVLRRELNTLKSEYIREHEISGRHFNSLRGLVDGRVDARKEALKNSIQSLLSSIDGCSKKIEKHKKELVNNKAMIKSIETYKLKVKIWREGDRKKKKPKLNAKAKKKDITELRKRNKKLSHDLHQKKRRLQQLKSRLDASIQKLNRKVPDLCFGSRELFKKQHYLGMNQYDSHEAWLLDWQQARSSQSYWKGSHEESLRNQNAQLDTEKWVLSLRLPKALKEFGDYLSVPLHPEYGKDELVSAIHEHHSVFDKKKRQFVNRHIPVSYRIMENESGFVVMTSFDRPKIEKIKTEGAIGIDLNADHLAVCEIDRHGNPIAFDTYPLPIKGLSAGQSSSILGDHLKQIVDRAFANKRKIAIEDLDFSKKKQALREKETPFYRQMLSSFMYNKFQEMSLSQAKKQGVPLQAVNPAFSSVIGSFKFLGYKASSHELAALAIARRALRFSERPKIKHALLETASIPDFGDIHLFIQQKGIRHIWSFYSRNKKPIRETCYPSSIGRVRPEFYNPLYPSGHQVMNDWVKERQKLRKAPLSKKSVLNSRRVI